MADIPDLRKNIPLPGAQFRSAVSEFLIQTLGGSINFINNRQYTEKQFYANGSYNIASFYPQLAVDGLNFFQNDAQIIDVWMFVEIQGSSGTTELDLKRATTSGGSFTSIFTTTPKISFNAGDYTYIHIGSSVPNTVAPVLSITNMNAGDALRMDIINVQGGPVSSAGLSLHYRPR